MVINARDLIAEHNYWVLSRCFQKTGCDVSRESLVTNVLLIDSSRLTAEETFISLTFLVLTDQILSSAFCRDFTNSRNGIYELLGFLHSTNSVEQCNREN